LCAGGNQCSRSSRHFYCIEVKASELMRGLKRLRRVVSSVFELYEYNKPLTLFQVKVVSSQQIQLPTPCEMTICPLVMDFRTHHSRYVAEESGNLRRYFFAVVILEFCIVASAYLYFFAAFAESFSSSRHHFFNSFAALWNVSLRPSFVSNASHCSSSPFILSPPHYDLNSILWLPALGSRWATCGRLEIVWTRFSDILLKVVRQGLQPL